MKIYIADFECTTGMGYTKEGRVRVYWYRVIDMDTEVCISTGVNIEQFMEWIESLNTSITLYFHNGGGYDNWFILMGGLLDKYIQSEDRYELNNNEYSLIIKNNKNILSLTIRNNKGQYIKIKDSLSLLNASIGDIGSMLKYPKGDIKYHILSSAKTINEFINDNKLPSKIIQEVDKDTGELFYSKDTNGALINEYGIRDVEILAKGLKEFEKIIARKYWKLTLSQTVYNWLIKRNTLFNTLTKLDADIYDDLRNWYRGGYTIVNEEKKYKEQHNVKTYDVNGFYQSIFLFEYLPFGIPYKGDSGNDTDLKLYSIYIIHMECKKNKSPFIPKKGINISSFDNKKDYNFIVNYPYTIKNTRIYLCDIELDLFFDTYKGKWKDINVEYSFKKAKGLISKEIEYFSNLKEKFTKEGNLVARQQTKLSSNTFYGKLAQKRHIETKVISPYNGEKINNVYELILNNSWKITKGMPTTLKPKYVPMSLYITAYCRVKLLTLINADYKNFIYCDTDSIHTTGKFPKNIIDNYKTGYWKFEGEYKKAYYREAKQYYLYNNEKDKKIKIAGVIRSETKDLKYKDFATENDLYFKYGTNVKVYCDGGVFFYKDKKVISKSDRKLYY